MQVMQAMQVLQVMQSQPRALSVSGVAAVQWHNRRQVNQDGDERESVMGWLSTVCETVTWYMVMVQ